LIATPTPFSSSAHTDLLKSKIAQVFGNIPVEMENEVRVFRPRWVYGSILEWVGEGVVLVVVVVVVL